MINFNKLIQAKFTEMCKTGKLYRVNITGQQIWDLYLKSFKPENDPIFRDPNSTSHTCNHCSNFVRRYGNIVSVNDKFEIETIWDVACEEEYKTSALVMSLTIKTAKISEVFFETFAELQSLPYESCSKTQTTYRLGIDRNIKRYTKEEAKLYGVVKANETRTFHHMHLDLPKQFVDQSGKSVESIMGEYRDAKNVFQRAMEEISLDTLYLVKDLIVQGSLLDGQTHLFKLEQFIPFKKAYDALSAGQKDNWCWVMSYRLPIAKFKNELIGTLCSELAEGEELNKACQSWNKRVDPANYMKATAPITKKQIEEAKKFVEENGYEESFDRRFANMDDIKVSEILHSNVGTGKIPSVSIFDGVKSTSTRHKRNEFEGIAEVSIDTFMKDILPTATSVEVYLKNNHEGNMVSLTTANNPDSKKIMKWDNNYSWTFSGNLAGKSQIKEAVKSQGGKVDGVLRFSIGWAEEAGDNSDLDAHCIEPNRNEIYFVNSSSRTGGNLDIDITQPDYHKANKKQDVVENITYPDLKRMPDGVYKFFVHQFSARGSKGFKAEIEFDGQLYSYIYNRAVSGNVQVAEVTLKDGTFTIKHILPAHEGEGVNKEIYGLETNNFHKVNLMCLSPNHWGDNNIGNKHYFFMLDKCKSPVSIRSFHVENLNADLLNHKKVMEVLGNTTMIEPVDKQLSGLGFNATVRDELIVKLGGTHKRMIKLKF